MANQLLDDLEKKVKPRGWYLHRKGKHHIYRHPDGGQVVVHSSKVAGSARTLNNLLTEFKRQELGIGVVRRSA